MSVSIRQLHPHFFGEVSGVDLRKPLTPQEAASFRPIPAKFSLLSARVVNPKGGNTEFADMRAAAPSPRRKTTG